MANGNELVYSDASRINTLGITVARVHQIFSVFWKVVNVKHILTFNAKEKLLPCKEKTESQFNLAARRQDTLCFSLDQLHQALVANASLSITINSVKTQSLSVGILEIRGKELQHRRRAL